MTTISDHTQNPAAGQQCEYLVPEHRTTDNPVRILHVLGGMDRGGVETWLMHVLRHIDRQQFHMDFLVHTDRRCAYDDEVEALGSSIFYCPKPSNPLQYAWNFRRILREQRPYDVVHSHVHHFSGFVLAVAKRAGIQTRIAHSHSNTARLDFSSHLVRRLYLRASQVCIRRYASKKLAASELAAQSLFGPGWPIDPNTSVLYCGLDFRPFHAIPDRELRAQFGFGNDEFIIGHVGRFTNEKNHDFLLRVHAEVLRYEPKARLLLVGKGPLEETTRALAKRLGIGKFITFAGIREDVPRLMLGAMDVFVLPSLHEGLPLVAIEAQAAGLPTLLSDQVTREADAHCGLLQFVEIKESAEYWAVAILRHARECSSRSVNPLIQLNSSSFSVARSTKALCQLYVSALNTEGYV